MAGTGEPTRRVVLTAIGGSVCAGTASARRDNENNEGGEDSENNEGGEDSEDGENNEDNEDSEDEPSGDEDRDPIDETGVVVRFESCTRVRVRSHHDVERLEVALEWDDRSEWWVIEEPVLPLTIDSSNSPWSEHEPIVHSVSVVGADRTGTYVTLPDSWEC